MSYRLLPEFMAKLQAEPELTARALEFTILTAARVGETLGAEWSEFDLDARLWVIPASRMKKGDKEHRVPLSDRAVEILEALPRDQRPFLTSLESLHRLKRRLGVRGPTIHGFRSAFRDWAAEATKFPTDAIEMALSHSVGNSTERSYFRSDLFDIRRKLMCEWAYYAIRGDKFIPS